MAAGGPVSKRGCPILENQEFCGCMSAAQRRPKEVTACNALSYRRYRAQQQRTHAPKCRDCQYQNARRVAC